MHTLRLLLKTTTYDRRVLETRFRLISRIHNTVVKRAKKLLKRLHDSPTYQAWLNEYGSLNGKDDEMSLSRRQELADLMNDFRDVIGLTKGGLYMYIKVQQKRFSMHISSQQAQKEVDRVWSGVEKVLFGDGRDIHFKKATDFKTICGKSPANGARFYDHGHTEDFPASVRPIPEWDAQIEWLGLQIEVKVDYSDPYIAEALSHPVKYCEIERIPFPSGYRYYVILYLDGPAPKKLIPGSSTMGIDPGVSTIAASSETNVFLEELAPDVMKYKKEIAKLQVSVDRSKRLSNPDNYNENGTIKKGKHKWKLTKSCKRKQWLIKVYNRKCSDYTKQSHERMCNRLIEDSIDIKVEPMDYKALMKRSKKTERQEKNLPSGRRTERSKRFISINARNVSDIPST